MPTRLSPKSDGISQISKSNANLKKMILDDNESIEADKKLQEGKGRSGNKEEEKGKDAGGKDRRLSEKENYAMG